MFGTPKGREDGGLREVFNPVPRGSLYESVYSRIALALIEGELGPDEKLRIRALAEQLGTSVTPVRDAILRLVQDGALEWRSPKDIRVPRIQVAQFEEIRIIRLQIEGLAARLAAQKASQADIEALETIVRDNEAARSNMQSREAVRLNRLFHAEISRIAALPLLDEIIQRMWLRMGPIISTVYAGGGRVMIQYHYEILEAVRRGDGVAAEKAIHADINAAAEIVLASDVLGNAEARLAVDRGLGQA
jgi:DNA-binding GntR family transcriptional regulator